MQAGIDLEQAMATALEAARRARTAIARYRHDTTAVEYKDDASPVTSADRDAERAIRDTLQAAYPDHAILGEEFGGGGATGGCLWLLDPIDGTKSWIDGLPFWSIQIALRVGERFCLGVSLAPGADELACAGEGLPATINDRPVRTSTTTRLPECRLSIGNVQSLAADPAAWQNLASIVSRCYRVRGYGDYYHYHRLAAGQLDAVIESDVNILDVAALSVIVHAAGGIMTDLQGRPLDLDSRSVLAASTPALHREILRRLQTDE